jgi:hypothetical protein
LWTQAEVEFSDSKRKRMEHIMKVYLFSPVEVPHNLEKKDDDDGQSNIPHESQLPSTIVLILCTETRTQVVDDEENLNFNTQSQGSKGSLNQSSSAVVNSLKANQTNMPLGRGGSPLPLFVPVNTALVIKPLPG